MSTCSQTTYPSVQSTGHSPSATISRNNDSWVILTHNDPALVDELQSLPKYDTSGMIVASQDSWAHAVKNLCEVINDRENEDHPVQLAVIGHSEASSNSRVENASNGQRKSIFTGAKNVLNTTKKSKEAYAGQIATILAHEEIQSAINSGQLIVHTLFYLAYCHTYLVFDHENQSFSPLGSPVVV